MTTQEQIAIMQAYVDGKQVEFCNPKSEDGWNLIHKPSWDWSEYEYRVKVAPEPKRIPRTMADLPEGGVLWVRDKNNPCYMALVVWIDPSGIIFRECEFALSGAILYAQDRPNLEISADRETWLPWWKEVTNE